MSMFATDDKYQDRSWDWAKKMSNLTEPGWRTIFNQSLFPTTGAQSPWTANTMAYAEQAMAPYSQGNVGFDPSSDVWQTLQSAYAPFKGGKNPYESTLYQGAEDLYQPTVDPLYDQLMDPLKRGIEGQYGNTVDRMLASGVRGGALSDALAEAAMGRSTQLSDMERSLRAQDIARLDVNQRERANALSGLAQSIWQTNRAGQLARSQALANSAMGLEQLGRNQSLMADMSLVNLLQQLTSGDLDRATNMANMGMQGRYLTGNQLAGQESSAGAGMAGGMMNMGAMLGMGLGSNEKLFSGLFGPGNIGGMNAGATAASTMAQLAALGIF
jgi:hypothetical protein